MERTFPWPHIVGSWLACGWLLRVTAADSALFRIASFVAGLALYLLIARYEWRRTFGASR